MEHFGEEFPHIFSEKWTNMVHKTMAHVNRGKFIIISVEVNLSKHLFSKIPSIGCEEYNIKVSVQYVLNVVN